MSQDRQPPAPSSQVEHDPSCPAYVPPLRVVETLDAQGQPTLEIVESPYEQTYRLGDVHATKLFLALCRSQELMPYRHRRQHTGTICVRATTTEHQRLWAQFLDLCKQLDSKLMEVTLAFVKSVEARTLKC
jgi:hypothetical protein